MIIACDYDKTLVTDDFHINYPLFNKLKKMQQAGHEIILWTCREGAWLEEAVDFCKSLGLVFDAVNENAPSTIKRCEQKYMSLEFCGKRKIIADFYVDDRNVSINSFISIDFK